MTQTLNVRSMIWTMNNLKMLFYYQYRHVSPGDAAFLISVGGISNTIGRLTGGWLSDLPQLHPLALDLVIVTIACVPTTLLGICWAYWTFLVSFGAFGFLTGIWWNIGDNPDKNQSFKRVLSNILISNNFTIKELLLDAQIQF